MRICNTLAFIDFSYTLTHNYLQIMTEKKMFQPMSLSLTKSAGK